MSRESRVQGRESRVESPESRVESRGSRVEGRESKVLSHAATAWLNDAGDILVGCGLDSYLYRNGDLIDLEGAVGDAGPYIDFGCVKMNQRGQLACRAWVQGSGYHLLRLTPIQPPL
ncbi:MAG TPA: hypothetical protein VJM31_04815 [Vicinamibacterales bacterium]|nr:hypothetical protein [Vicinamibacterales bacterium]